MDKKELKENQMNQIAAKLASTNIPTILTHQVHVADFIIQSKPNEQGKVMKSGQILLNFTDITNGHILAKFALNLTSAKDLKISLDSTIIRLEKELVNDKPLAKAQQQKEHMETKMIA